MLIRTNRHRPEDLELWESYEQGDFANASFLQTKIDQAVEVIQEFAKLPCYAGISWGKDSVAMLHLIAKSGVKIPCVWIRVEPIANPDCHLVRDAFLQKHDVDYYEITRYCTRDRAGWHASGTLESGAEEASKRFSGRRMLGIRADESGSRRITCYRNGAASVNSCRPLAWWSADDVMAYLAMNDLPVHPAYGMLGGGRYDRQWLRVASIGGERGRGMMRNAWETEYYGDVLRRILAGK